MTSQEFASTAKSLLSQQIELSTSLNETLTSEYDCLNSRNIDALEQLANDKQPLIIELDSINKQWLALLETQIQDISIEKIKNLLIQLDNEFKLDVLKLWESLQSLAKQCQRQNSINGTIITLSYQNSLQTLSILRGQQPGDNIYNPSGNQVTTYSAGHSFAKA